jgi:hypothetical protein
LTCTDQRGDAERVRLPKATPLLAPSQEWRTFWDDGVERSRSVLGLPDRYDITATYPDSFSTPHTTPSVLDWSVIRLAGACSEGPRWKSLTTRCGPGQRRR